MAHEFHWDSLQVRMNNDPADLLEQGYEAGSQMGWNGPGRFTNTYRTYNAILKRTMGGAASRCIMGMSYFCNNTAALYVLFRWYDGATTQCSLRYNWTNKRIELVQGDAGTVLAQSADNSFMSAVWHYFEVDITIGVAGSFKLYVEGNPVPTIDVSGINTASGTSVGQFTRWAMEPVAVVHQYHDILYVIADPQLASDARFSALLGPVRAFLQVPTGAGSVGEWAASSGQPYQTVDDIHTAGAQTGDYIKTSTAGHKSLFEMQALPAEVGTVIAYENFWAGWKDDAAFRQVRQLEQSDDDSTQRTGDTVTLTASLQGKREKFLVNPFTGDPLTKAFVENAQLGVENVA